MRELAKIRAFRLFLGELKRNILHRCLCLLSAVLSKIGPRIGNLKNKINKSVHLEYTLTKCSICPS